jgi:hypothetical protein
VLLTEHYVNISGSDTTESDVIGLYISYMSRVRPHPPIRPTVRPRRPPCTSLLVKVGGWFEAQATGWGVLVVPLILLALLAAAALGAAPPWPR